MNYKSTLLALALVTLAAACSANTAPGSTKSNQPWHRIHNNVTQEFTNLAEETQRKQMGESLCNTPELQVLAQENLQGNRILLIQETCPLDSETTTRIWAAAEDSHKQTMVASIIQSQGALELQANTSGDYCEWCLGTVQAIFDSVISFAGGLAAGGCMSAALTAAGVTLETGPGSLVSFVVVGLACGFLAGIPTEALKSYLDKDMTLGIRYGICTTAGLCGPNIGDIVHEMTKNLFPNDPPTIQP